MLALTNSYEAYCLDEAIGFFGSWVEGELDKVKAKTPEQVAKKREGKLQYLLTGNRAKMYTDPATKVRGR